LQRSVLWLGCGRHAAGEVHHHDRHWQHSQPTREPPQLTVLASRHQGAAFMFMTAAGGPGPAQRLAGLRPAVARWRGECRRRPPTLPPTAPHASTQVLHAGRGRWRALTAHFARAEAAVGSRGVHEPRRRQATTPQSHTPRLRTPRCVLALQAATCHLRRGSCCGICSAGVAACEAQAALRANGLRNRGTLPKWRPLHRNYGPATRPRVALRPSTANWQVWSVANACSMVGRKCRWQPARRRLRGRPVGRNFRPSSQQQCVGVPLPLLTLTWHGVGTGACCVGLISTARSVTNAVLKHRLPYSWLA